MNGKVYIGQTRYTVEFRWRQHIHTKDNAYFHKAIQKYGSDNFTVETLEECEYKYLNAKEIFYIAKYNSFKKGYNSTIGGDGKATLLLDDKYDEIKRLYLSGFSSIKIANLYEVDKASIIKVLKQLGVKLRNRTIDINKQEFEEIVQMYKTGHSLKSIAKMYDCTGPGLKEFLIKKGVDIKDKLNILKDEKMQQAMINDYLDDSIKMNELFRKYHCSYKTFKTVLSLHGIDLKGQKFHFKMSDNECLECIKLRNEGWLFKNLAHKYGVDKTTIYNMFKRYHVN